MEEHPEDLLKELYEIIDLSADELLDRQINRACSGAADARLPPEKRAVLKARLESDIGKIRALVEERAYQLANVVVEGLIELCHHEDYKRSGEKDGLGQVLPVMDSLLCLLDDLQGKES